MRPQSLPAHPPYTTNYWALSQEFGATLLCLLIFGSLAWIMMAQAFDVLEGEGVDWGPIMLVWILLVTIYKVHGIIRDE